MAETAVVGRPHDVYGEGKGYISITNSIVMLYSQHVDIYAFIVLKDGIEDAEEGVVSDM